jgi:hypothetical protein
MTQLQQADRRTNVLTSAFVAAAVSATITISGILIAGQLDNAGTVQAAPAAVDTAAQRLVAAERAWEDQRQQQSADWIRREGMLEQYGAEWQARYEQTNPND